MGKQVGQLRFLRRGPGAKPEITRSGHGEVRNVESNLNSGFRRRHGVGMRRRIQHASAVERLQAQLARRGDRPVAPQPLKLAPDAGTLSEHESHRLLAAYGIPVTRTRLIAPDAIDRLKRAPLAYPLAVKIDSPDIAHKTEAGAVRLGVRNLRALKQAAHDVMGAARRYKPDAHINGVLLSEMAQGTEVIVGAVNDRFFGPVVMLGLGGVFTELLQAVSYRFAPFDLDTAHDMIHAMPAHPVLTGYRGKPALAIDALADALVRVSLLVADHAARIAEIDINPLFVGADNVVAADALVVLRA